MTQTVTATIVKTGVLEIPPALRAKSILTHGTPVEILEDQSSVDPKKMKIRVGSREYNVDPFYVKVT